MPGWRNLRTSAPRCDVGARRRSTSCAHGASSCGSANNRRQRRRSKRRAACTAGRTGHWRAARRRTADRRARRRAAARSARPAARRRDAGEQHRIDDLRRCAGSRCRPRRQRADRHARRPARSKRSRTTQPLADGGQWQRERRPGRPAGCAAAAGHACARADTDRGRRSRSTGCRAAPVRGLAAGRAAGQRPRARSVGAAPAAPVTALDLDARVQSRADDAPAAVSAAAEQPRAGPLERRPAAAARLLLDTARATRTSPTHLEVQRFEAALGSAADSGGRSAATATGSRSAGSSTRDWSARARRRLDARAPAMHLDGQVGLRGQGFDGRSIDDARVDVRAELTGRARELRARSPCSSSSTRRRAAWAWCCARRSRARATPAPARAVNSSANASTRHGLWPRRRPCATSTRPRGGRVNWTRRGGRGRTGSTPSWTWT